MGRTGCSLSCKWNSKLRNTPEGEEAIEAYTQAAAVVRPCPCHVCPTVFFIVLAVVRLHGTPTRTFRATPTR